MPSLIAEFFLGHSPDDRGRTFAQILAFNDEELERYHDFIQWIFPTTTPSAFNADAPLVDEGVAQEFRDDPSLREALLGALRRMLAFYGFQLIEDGGDVRVERLDEFGRITTGWLQPGNHNMLRLSRILESLSLLGCGAHAAALLTALRDVGRDHPNAVSAETMQYWVARSTSGSK